MRPQTLATIAVLCLLAPPAFAQVDYRPTPPPATSASDRTWYRDGDPIPFAGDLYYPTGPTVYFNGDTMVPTGEYDGVTLYADTTLEPYGTVFVPVADKLLRPYERVRAAGMAGTTYSGVPGREVDVQPYESREKSEAMAPMQPRGPRRQPGGRRAEAAPLEPFEPYEERVGGGLLVESVRKPTDNLGIWVAFQGFRWQHSGDAVPFDPTKLVTVGDYYGLHVFADSRTPYVIYIPSRGNLVAPFKRMGS